MSAHRLLLCALCVSLSPVAAFAQTDADNAARLAERLALNVSAEIRAKCEKLLGEWKDRFDEEKFNYLVAPPFVIAGNGRAETLKRYRDGTILAATRCLQKQFFKKQPAEPVMILLFESAGPYKRLAKKWFNDNDVPYYGYFRNDNVMVMNVGTGTGTLVHELTHALIKPDFPAVPGWFNEGLASLYEQCSIAFDDTIKGHENWRLPGLQKAMSAGKLDDFNHSISFMVSCDDQAELDRYWDALLKGGGTPEQCGWMCDRYGLRWQIVPAKLQDMLTDPDRELAKKTVTA